MKLTPMDLHIHSSLSPCGSSEMTPPNVLKKAVEVGLEAIVVADHNSAENQEAFLKLGEKMGIKILPGMEVQSREDVHVVCIFDNLEQILAWQEIVYSNLPPLTNKGEIFGSQQIVDWQGTVRGECDKLLLTATNISVDDIYQRVVELGGLPLPAHIDRPSFSLWSQLGFLNQDFQFLGVELTAHLPRSKTQIDFITKNNLGVVISSDAHHLNQLMGAHTWGYIEDFTVQELTLALKKEKGRYLCYSKEANPFS